MNFTLEELIIFVKEFEGIIGATFGALAGTIGTLITTHILKNKGKCKVCLNSSKIEKGSYSTWGEYQETGIDVAEFLKIEFELEIYNTSEIPKYLKNFELEIRDRDNCLIKTISEIKDTNSGRYGSAVMIYDFFNHINLTPKILEKIKLHVNLDLIENEDLRGLEKVNLTYLDSKNKKKVIEIH